MSPEYLDWRADQNAEEAEKERLVLAARHAQLEQELDERKTREESQRLSEEQFREWQKQRRK